LLKTEHGVGRGEHPIIAKISEQWSRGADTRIVPEDGTMAPGRSPASELLNGFGYMAYRNNLEVFPHARKIAQFAVLAALHSR